MCLRLEAWMARTPFSSESSWQENLMIDPQRRQKFHVVLIKPSHYDDDGYVIQWYRSSMPSNSLAVLHGLAADCAERQILGPHVEITIEATDETNERVVPEAIVARL